MSTEQRLLRLEAAEKIRQLKARYAALADAKYTQNYQRQPEKKLREIAWQQALCFSQDASWHAGDEFGGVIFGREKLHDWFCRAPWIWAMHFYSSPTIELLDESNATAQWRLFQIALKDEKEQAVLLCAGTNESYQRSKNGEWLHHSVQFTELQILNLEKNIATIASALA